MLRTKILLPVIALRDGGQYFCKPCAGPTGLATPIPLPPNTACDPIFQNAEQVQSNPRLADGRLRRLCNHLKFIRDHPYQGDSMTALNSKTITYEQLAKAIDHSLLRPSLPRRCDCRL